MNSYQIEYFDNQDNLLTFFVEITDYSPGYPAKTWALPEDCYEGCPEEIEFTVTSVTMTDENGLVLDVTKDIDTNEYVDFLEEQLLGMMREDADDYDGPEDDFSQYPDYYDY